jgi:cytochrome c553
VLCGVLAASSANTSAQSTFKGDAKKGAAKARTCEACHGTPKNPPLPAMPALFGQQPEFLVLQMFFIRERLRNVPQMEGLLKGVSDAELTDMAAYFASGQPARVGPKPDVKLRERGAELSKKLGCGSCHMPDYSGQRQVPRLTGQREDYLVTALKDYRDNKRSGSDTSMNAVLYQVPDNDIAALAHYLATQK